VTGVENPYLLDEPVVEPEPTRGGRRLPVRAIVWAALLVAVVIAATVLAVQIHEQNSRIRQLQRDNQGVRLADLVPRPPSLRIHLCH
jgi:hypothetical protein